MTGENATTETPETHAGIVSSDPEFIIERVFDAPRDLVFKVWTDADHLTKWWGPKGFTMLSCTLDLQPGGVFLYGMKSPGGDEMWGRWVFHDITEPERLSFISSFSDPDGNMVRAPFSQEWPMEILSMVTFDEQDGRTTVTMRGVPINATEGERKAFEDMFSSMQQGWTGTLDQLAAHLEESR